MAELLAEPVDEIDSVNAGVQLLFGFYRYFVERGEDIDSHALALLEQIGLPRDRFIYFD